MKRKFKGSKAFEFLTLFLMVIGTTVGGGIYLKNNELLKQTGNPIVAIILWFVVGLVCVLSLIVFLEISSSTKNFGNGTMGNWAKLFLNRKTASFFSIIYAVVYVPTIYALFAGSFIYYFFMLLEVNGAKISPEVQLASYLVGGVFIIAFFSIINGLKPQWSRNIQVVGTVFKFIPLAIAFIAGFCLIKTSGSTDDTSAIWNSNYDTNKWDGLIRGFGAILLSFDGYIYLANAQKDAKHKEVVPKALFAGLIVVAIFYVLMAVSLFLGTPDGKIESIFDRLPGNAGKIISALIMMIICTININVISMVGTVQIESDSAAKTLYTGANRHQVSKFKSAMVSALFTAIVFIVLMILGFFVKVDGKSGWNSTDGDKAGSALAFVNIMSSVGAIISFAMVTSLIFAMIWNRKTNKVKVDKKRGAVTCAWISGILFTVFIILGIYTFLNPNDEGNVWLNTSALPFLIIFIVMIAIAVIFWAIQEKLFKMYPFENGFEGEIQDKDPRPFIFKFNPIVNYYTKKGTKEVQEYQKRLKKEQSKKRQ